MNKAWLKACIITYVKQTFLLTSLGDIRGGTAGGAERQGKVIDLLKQHAYNRSHDSYIYLSDQNGQIINVITESKHCIFLNLIRNKF